MGWGFFGFGLSLVGLLIFILYLSSTSSVGRSFKQRLVSLTFSERRRESTVSPNNTLDTLRRVMENRPDSQFDCAD